MKLIISQNAFKNSKSANKCLAVLDNGKVISHAKTLFPARYNDPTVTLKELQLIIANPQNYSGPGEFIGKTSDGVRTFIRLSNQGKIITAYPMWEQF